LRPAEPSDAPAFAVIFRDPSVATWWDSDDPDAEAREHAGSVEWDRAVWAIEAPGIASVAGSDVVGLIQAYENADPQYRHAGIDLALSAACQGRGLGPDAIRAVARWLFGERGHHRIVIDPAAANERAIRAYRSVGFRPVGVMRAYERGADGTFRDGLLMEMLTGELV
jgi:aminoglycoside 6'-N-acetyltransferase